MWAELCMYNRVTEGISEDFHQLRESLQPLNRSRIKIEDAGRQHRTLLGFGGSFPAAPDTGGLQYFVTWQVIKAL